MTKPSSHNRSSWLRIQTQKYTSYSKRAALTVLVLSLVVFFGRRADEPRAMAALPASITYKKVEDGFLPGGLRYVVYAVEDTTTNKPVSARQSSARMANSREAMVLSNDLTQTIADLPFQGVYFETPGVSSSNADKQFRFCIVDGKRLANFAESRASPDAFEEHLSKCDSTYSCQFTNLGGDATLIAPKKMDSTIDNTTYSHLAAFLRGAPRNQVAAIWRKVGKAYQEILETRDPANPLWLSTAGEGVPWLHFRFDSRPKYYKYSQFANEK